MRTFKTIEDYKKYINDIYQTLKANQEFFEDKDIGIVLTTSDSSASFYRTTVMGEPIVVGTILCMIIRKLPKDLVKTMFKTLKKVK